MIETVTIVLTTAIAKYLAKLILPNEFLDEVATGLIGAGFGALKERRSVADQMGMAVAESVKVVYDRSDLAPNEKEAVFIDVKRALEKANISLTSLIETGLKEDVLLRKLLQSRLESDQPYLRGSDQDELSRAMLREAAKQMVRHAEKLEGFLSEAFGVSLRNLDELLRLQREQGEQLEEVVRVVLSLERLPWDRLPGNMSQEVITPDVYVGRLRQRAATLRLPGIPGMEDFELMLREVYVPLNSRISGAIDATPLLYVRDRAGTGKSTLLRQMIINECDRFLDDQDGSRAPVLLEARELQIGQGDAFEDSLAASLERTARLDPQAVGELLRQGKLTIFVDGLDEAPAAMRGVLVDAIGRSETVREPNGNRIVVAGRYLDAVSLAAFQKEELDRLAPLGTYKLIGNWRRFLEESNIQVGSLGNLDALMAYVAMRSTAGEKLPETLTIPLYVTYLVAQAVIGRDETLIKRLVDDPVHLYTQIIEVAIPYWEKYKNELRGSGALIDDELSLVQTCDTLYAIAFVQFVDGESGRLGFLFRGLRNHCDEYLRGVPEEKRIKAFSFWERASVLKLNWLDGTVSFWHQELREYCVARYLCDSFPTADDLPKEWAESIGRLGSNIGRMYDAMCSMRSGGGDDVT